MPPIQRAALAYAPARARSAWLGLLALDARLARTVRETREPMLGQIRLAWWRERLAEPPAKQPNGEPLLTLLGGGGERFVPLVDGWEAMLGEAPLSREAIMAFGHGRAKAMGSLAVALGCTDAEQAVESSGWNWALADLAEHVINPQEREQARALMMGRSGIALPRLMRPLVVLEGLARREAGQESGVSRAGGLLLTLRLGFFGR